MNQNAAGWNSLVEKCSYPRRRAWNAAISGDMADAVLAVNEMVNAPNRNAGGAEVQRLQENLRVAQAESQRHQHRLQEELRSAQILQHNLRVAQAESQRNQEGVRKFQDELRIAKAGQDRYREERDQSEAEMKVLADKFDNLLRVFETLQSSVSTAANEARRGSDGLVFRRKDEKWQRDNDDDENTAD